MTTRNTYHAAATPAASAFALEPLSPPGKDAHAPSPPASARTSSDSTEDPKIPGGDGYVAIPGSTWHPAPSATECRTHRSWLSNAFSAVIARASALAQGKWDPLAAPRELVRRNAGLLLIALSQALAASMNVTVKFLNGLDPPVPALEVIVVRMIITYICCIAYMLFTGVPHPFAGPPGVRILLVVRGIVGFFGLFGMYYSLQYLSLADATVLTFLVPFCTALTGAVLLGERMKRGDAVAGLLSLVGVLLIARPPFLFGGGVVSEEDGVTPAQRLQAVGIALVGVLGATGAFVTLRAIGKRAHTLHSLNSFSTQCILVSTILLVATSTSLVLPKQPVFLLLLLLIGLLGFAAQVLLVLGLQRETAGRGSIGMYAQLVFALAFERVVFGTRPSAMSVAGTAVIVGCAVYVAVTKKGEEGQSPGKGAEQDAEEGLLESVQDLDEEVSLVEQKINDGELD